MEQAPKDKKDFILFFAIFISVIASIGLVFSPLQSSSLTNEESIERLYDIKKITLEGHEYWHFTKFRRGGGICHSESCPCRIDRPQKRY